MEAKDKSAWKILPWIALVAGIANLIGLQKAYEKETAYENSMLTTGIVVAIIEHESTWSRRRFKLQVEYSDQDGDTHLATVESAYAEAKRVGQEMTISYRPEHRNVVRAPDERVSKDERLFWVILFSAMIVWGFVKIVWTFFSKQSESNSIWTRQSRQVSEESQPNRNIYNSPIARLFLLSIPFIVIALMHVFDYERYATTAVIVSIDDEGSTSRPFVEIIDEQLNVRQALVEETEMGDRLVVGSRLPIFYWPEQPSTVKIDRRDTGRWLVFYLLFATIFIGGAAIVGVVIRKKTADQQ